VKTLKSGKQRNGGQKKRRIVYRTSDLLLPRNIRCPTNAGGQGLSMGLVARLVQGPFVDQCYCIVKTRG
jgi:hypothetical protein